MNANSWRTLGMLCILSLLYCLWAWSAQVPQIINCEEHKTAETLRSKQAGWGVVPEDWKNEMAARRNNLINKCRQHKMEREEGTPIRDLLSPFMWVDDRHGLIYCEVPKVGCTNMLRLLYALTSNTPPDTYQSMNGGVVHSKFRRYLVPLGRFSDYGVQFRLKNYLKLISVRHPLERVVSAFRSKLEKGTNKFYSKHIGEKIAEKFEPNHGKSGKNGTVTFSGFVKYLVDDFGNKKEGELTDRHWMTYDKLCNPCDVKYDVIGRHETLDRDVNMVLKILGVGDKLRYPTSNMSAVSSADVWKTYYQNVSKADVRSLWRFYEMDGALFDYALDV